jgi:hypothetical protein
MTLIAAFQFLFIHLGVTALALGMNRIAQRRSVSIGLLAVALVACARLGLDVRAVVTISTARGVLIHMILVAVGKLAQFGMMTAHTGFLGQIFLVVRSELRIKFCRMT